VAFGRESGVEDVPDRVNGCRLVEPTVSAVCVDESDRLLDETLDAVGDCGVDERGGGFGSEPIVNAPALPFCHGCLGRNRGCEMDHGVHTGSGAQHRTGVEQVNELGTCPKVSKPPPVGVGP
jgi:hypothetical protein